jgi:predicted HicB family RNase H-like nuclease
MKESKTYPLRLPRSLKEAVKRLSREDRTSINQFVATAVAEKVSALQTATILRGPEGACGFQCVR